MALALALVTPLAAQVGASPLAQAASEDDWWLPDWVKPSANSGYYGGSGGGAGFPDLVDCKIVWRLVNPREGEYDWTSVDKQLALGKPVWVRFFASDTGHCPPWLASKYPTLGIHRFRWPATGYDDIVGYLSVGRTVRSPGDFYAIWDPSFEQEFRKLLDAFRARYGGDKRMAFCYFPHAWRWGEFSLKWVPEMAKSGFTPQQYLEWFQRTTADYTRAFNGASGKLVYTGFGGKEWIENSGDAQADVLWDRTINTPDGGNALARHALGVGGGVRDGFTEVFNRFSESPAWGMTLEPRDGFQYSRVDEAHPLIASTDRFFGTENEDYDYMWPGTNTYYFVKTAYLNTLRLRMNWVFAGDYRTAPPVVEYARLALGKHVHDSPDAWAALRQYQDCQGNDENAPDTYRNFERWLVQREVVPDGRTVRAYRADFPAEFAAENCGGAWEALRTDQASGGTSIYFEVNDRFLKGGPYPVQVKVTYLDNFPGEWRLEYDAAAGNAYKAAAPVRNSNDGRWKTATFSVSDAAFENRQKGGMDFRISPGGTHDLTARFVRVIKMRPPGPVGLGYLGHMAPETGRPARKGFRFIRSGMKVGLAEEVEGKMVDPSGRSQNLPLPTIRRN